ncbi:hypothetical protein ACEWY4_012543 [Coilia grayii]|uniref:DDE-1 domain-containing protein n=1 Tax=Coilia grayii TaxID=363190 RepID=A0ABD1K0W9_9TELE
MPRTYKRKTDRASQSRAVLERAAEEVRKGRPIRAVARDMRVDRMTLTRFIEKTKDGGRETGYANLALAHMVFNSSIEADLASHIKTLSFQFHSLSPVKCRQLAYEFGKLNNITIPDNWHNNERAGMEWFQSFMKRHKLSCRMPEATSIGRQTAFNRHTVGEFYDNLATVMDRYKFPPNRIYNVDETGVTDIQKPKQVVTERGRKQVGSVTSKERGELITLICAVNALGNAVPPLFIFPRVRFHSHFLKGSPVGSIGCSTKSGWTNQEIFVTFLKHLIQHTNCCPTTPLLLILDNHDSHVALEAVNVAKENGIIMLTLPPHTSHQLQPLDKSVFGPLKRYYNRAVDGWMRSNPGKVATIYDVPEMVNTAFRSAMSRQNIQSGFEATGIFPYNREKFTDADFEPAEVSNRPAPAQPGQQHDAPASPGQETGGYQSPASIMPLPKAAPRKALTKRKRVKTRILTDTPVKEELERMRELKKTKELKKPPKVRRKIPVENEDSSSDDTRVTFDDDPDSPCMTSDEEDQSL